MIGEQSNTNLNNSNDHNNTQANVSDDDKITKSSSKVVVGHMVSTASSDSVFVRNEAMDTRTQESIVETPAAHSMQLEESANQETVETTQIEGEGEKASSEQPDGAAGEENVARPSSSMSRMEIDECNSVSQLPKVIVKKSINAAINRLSLHKDPSSDGDNAETNIVNEKQSEAVPQENQVQQIVEGENVKENQPEAAHNEGIDTQEEEVKETNDGDLTTESQNVQEGITTKSEGVETAKAPATATTQSEKGGTSEEVIHESSSTTNTAANEDSSNDQEPPAAVEASSDAGVEEKAPEDEPATEQEAPASDGNVVENNTNDQAGDVGVTGPTQVEKNDSEEVNGGSSKTPEEIAPLSSGDESATPIETQNKQQQEDDPPQ